MNRSPEEARASFPFRVCPTHRVTAPSTTTGPLALPCPPSPGRVNPASNPADKGVGPSSSGPSRIHRHLEPRRTLTAHGFMDMRRRRSPDVSIVLPVLNEEGSVRRLAQEIQAAFSGTPWSWECLWIDDGSTDRTLRRLEELHSADPRHRYLSLSCNCGQSAALSVGFARARGRILATLDGDLQNDPADLPRLVREMEASCLHMVNGVRVRRRDSALRRLVSRLANRFRNRVTGAAVTDAGCSTRVFYRECIDGLAMFRGMHRFLPTLVEMQGYRMSEVPVNHRPRTHGRSTYGIPARLWVGLVDTLGVRWLRERALRPEVKASSDEEDLMGALFGSPSRELQTGNAPRRRPTSAVH